MGSYHEVTGDHPLLEEFAMGEWVLCAQKLLPYVRGGRDGGPMGA
jgi:hypothetical protein